VGGVGRGSSLYYTVWSWRLGFDHAQIRTSAGHATHRNGIRQTITWSAWWPRATCWACRPRRVERLVEQLGVASLSKSQVSEMAQHLDAQVEAFRNRPLDAGPYTFVWVDALAVKVREGGRTVNVHALIAVAVNGDGQREVLGLDVAAQEDDAGWLGLLRSLTARGLSGVRLVVSGAHRGLVDAIAAALPGASWQRCRTHYLRNLLTKVPRSAQPWVATMVRTIFDQPDADAVRDQYAGR
jgi:putative transposase